jgi:hypothetical protein
VHGSAVGVCLCLSRPLLFFSRFPSLPFVPSSCVTRSCWLHVCLCFAFELGKQGSNQTKDPPDDD